MPRKNTSRSLAPNTKTEKIDDRKKTYLSQTEVPNYSLEQALRVPKAVAENFGYKPTKPLQVAKAMSMQPNSG